MGGTETIKFRGMKEENRVYGTGRVTSDMSKFNIVSVLIQ